MRRILLGFVLGLTLAVAAPALGTHYEHCDSSGLAGVLKSSNQAQWQLVYWQRKQVGLQERALRDSKEQTREIIRAMADQTRAIRELTSIVRQKK